MVADAASSAISPSSSCSAASVGSTALVGSGASVGSSTTAVASGAVVGSSSPSPPQAAPSRDDRATTDTKSSASLTLDMGFIVALPPENGFPRGGLRDTGGALPHCDL